MQISHYPQSLPAYALLGSGSWVTGDTSSQPPLPPKDGLGAGVCSVNPRHFGQVIHGVECCVMLSCPAAGKVQWQSLEAGSLYKSTLNLQSPCKKLGVATCVCNPSIRGGDRGILRSLWPDNLAEKASFWVSERLETVSWNTTEEESLRPCSGFLVHSFLHSPHTRPAYSHANTMNAYHKHNAYLQNSKIKYIYI